jgi:hypothetical protein
MAKYRYQCEDCSIVFERYTSVSIEALPCKECGAKAKRLFPNIGSKKVTETVDSFTNIRHEEDNRKNIENRRLEHFWSVEVPRFVQSGIYSTETMLAEGWIVYDEKQELVVAKGPKGK